MCSGYIHLSYAEVVSETVVPPPSGVGQCYPSGLASTRHLVVCVRVMINRLHPVILHHSLFVVNRAERGLSSGFAYSQFQLFGFTVIFVIVIRVILFNRLR